NPTPATMARSRGLKAAHRGSLRSILDSRPCPTSVISTRMTSIARPPAFTVSPCIVASTSLTRSASNSAGKPFSINISRVAPARLYVGEHFQGSALLGTKRHRSGEQCHIRYQRQAQAPCPSAEQTVDSALSNRPTGQQSNDQNR